MVKKGSYPRSPPPNNDDCGVMRPRKVGVKRCSKEIGSWIVSGKRLVGLIVFVVTLLVSSIDVGMPNTARADDCLTAPNSPAPQGTHWYYHVDRTNQRKCWYVRATSQPAQQAAAQATSEAASAAQSHSMPMSSGPMPATAAASAPMSISPGNSAPRLPHVRILAVKPKLAAAISATTDKSVRSRGRDSRSALDVAEMDVSERRGDLNRQREQRDSCASPQLRPDPAHHRNS
jgi:hypothetical protein